MQKQSYISSLLFAIILISCQTKEQKKTEIFPKNGSWRMEMDLNHGNVLPFHFDWSKKGSQWKMVIKNAEERIITEEIVYKKDSFFIQLPVFESEFILTVTNDTTLSGVWKNYYKGPDYSIPVKAYFGGENRFAGTENASSTKDYNGRFKTTFSPDTKDAGQAIGIFKQKGNSVTGTFATERGDYRHLEGNVYGEKLFLSTFDGSHAFLFTGTMKDSVINGKFYSGTHWEEDWIAEKNDTFQLRDADSLTFLKEGYERIEFSFPNSEKQVVTLNDERYKEKAVIVQIMGTWCPNCLDETLYLSKLYEKYKDSGLEIVALAFERTRTEEKAFKNIARLKERTGATYEILLGGATRDDKAAEKLPMLNHVMSYPTAIFIDKNKKVRRIHTGFYGPSTGHYYDQFTAKTESLVQEMLNE